MVEHSTVLLVMACRHATVSFLHKDVGLCAESLFSRFLADFIDTILAISSESPLDGSILQVFG